ncbi:MAG: 2-C-methyl-D-erythritol 4-phosphate cytidylyltransferase [Cyclobacteriaceae bacterium]|nr:2-C-methyl-D-erythritol 4-phosphate cytidylyltransferase [Cyclobacteriaceae bacterium]
MKKYALIVAGGKGTRMCTEVPKQFLLLKGRPVLMHTLEAFYLYSKKIIIILGLPKDDIILWEKLCEEHNFKIPHSIVVGGNSRFQTVKRGLDTINEEGLVAIHDGVRPLIRKEVIAASFNIAQVHKTAVASLRLKESLRKINQDGSEAVDRSQYRIIQTPQTFDLDLIKKAYNVEERSWMTDDASVAESSGYSISLFEGHYENIKITTPSDLPVAEALIKLIH